MIQNLVQKLNSIILVSNDHEMAEESGESAEVCTFNFNFTGLPECLKFTKSVNYIRSLIDNDPILINTAENATELNEDLLQMLSKMPSCTISFPKMFFNQNSDTYQRNVTGFLSLLQTCLLSQSGRNLSETNNLVRGGNQEDLQAAFHSSEDKNG